LISIFRSRNTKQNCQSKMLNNVSKLAVYMGWDAGRGGGRNLSAPFKTTERLRCN
jgi:hypothetical protein